MPFVLAITGHDCEARRLFSVDDTSALSKALTLALSH